MLNMPLKSLFLAILVGSLQTDVVLTGTVKSCFIGQPIVVGGVKVAAFQVSSVRPLVGLLQVMDTMRITQADTGSFNRFSASYDQVISLDTTTTALVRTTSATNGTFTLTMTPVDSVLVVGYDLNDEYPFFYSYAVLSGQSSASFLLDMSAGRCGN